MQHFFKKIVSAIFVFFLSLHLFLVNAVYGGEILKSADQNEEEVTVVDVVDYKSNVVKSEKLSSSETLETVTDANGISSLKKIDWNKDINIIVSFKKDPVLKKFGKKYKNYKKKRKKRNIKLSDSDHKEIVKAIDDLNVDYTKFVKDLKKIKNSPGKKFRKLKKTHKIIRKYKYSFNGVAVTVPRWIAERIKQLPYVEKVYEDKEVQVNLDTSIGQINADSVWSLGYTGQGITVGVIDTGIDYTHPDLGGGFGSGHKVTGGYDFVNNDNDPKDDHSHGTHVAGIIAGNGAIRGVAPDASLVAYKVLASNGSGKESDVIAAIERSCDPDQNPGTDDALDVINLSLSGPGNPDDPASTAIDNASDSGVTCVVAAGNNRLYMSIGSPGCARKAITVGAVNDNDNIASFSSKGPNKNTFSIKPDIVAPGVNINSSVLNGGYDEFDGTSMATPHVAGCAALLLQKDPTLTPENIKSILMTSSKDLGTYVFAQGNGRVNIFNAINEKTIVNPASISLGFDDPNIPVFTKSVSVELTNLNDIALNYSISADLSGLPGGITADIDNTNIDINPGETKSFIFTIEVDNSVVPIANNNSFSYQGKVDISNPLETISVPFAFIRSELIRLVFDEVPHSVSAFGDDGIILSVPERSKNMDILAKQGTYNIIATFYNYTTSQVYPDSVNIVTREGVQPDALQTININKSDAIHKVEMRARDENNQAIGLGMTQFAFYHNTIPISYMWCNLGWDEVYFSDTSENFTWEWVGKTEVANDTIYCFNGSISEIYDDYIFENTDSDLVHKTIEYNAPDKNNNIFILDYILVIPHHVGVALDVYDYRDPGLAYPFLRDFYMMPLPPSSSSAVKYYYSAIYRHTAKNIKHEYENLLYKTRPIKFYSNGKFEWQSYARDIEDMASYKERIKLGSGPVSLFAGVFSDDNTVEIRAYNSNFCGYFAGQRQSSFATEANHAVYELFYGDQLVSSGTLPGKDLGGLNKHTINIEQSGQYKLYLKSDANSIAGQSASVEAVCEFDTALSDADPPKFDYFYIICEEENTDIVESGKSSEIKFSLERNNRSNIDRVNLYYKTSGDWIELSLTGNASEYSASVPQLTENTHVSLKVEAVDIYGNKITYTMTPAFYYIVMDTPIAFDKEVTAVMDTPIDITLEGMDYLNKPLTYNVTVQPQNGFLSGTPPHIIYTPANDYIGNDIFKFKVNNGITDSTEAEVLIHVIYVNKAPVLDFIGDRTLDVNEPSRFAVTAYDVNNDALTLSASNLPQGADFVDLGNGIGLFIWTPQPDQLGIHSDIVFNVTDGKLDDSESIDITVFDPNNPDPIITVEAIDISAGEPDDIATFRITANRKEAGLIQVNYGLYGTAVNGKDYQRLDYSVVLSSSSTKADIDIIPIDDDLVENIENVSIKIKPGDYDIGTPAIASIVITSDDVSDDVTGKVPALHPIKAKDSKEVEVYNR